MFSFPARVCYLKRPWEKGINASDFYGAFSLIPFFDFKLVVPHTTTRTLMNICTMQTFGCMYVPHIRNSSLQFQEATISTLFGRWMDDMMSINNLHQMRIK